MDQKLWVELYSFFCISSTISRHICLNKCHSQSFHLAISFWFKSQTFTLQANDQNKVFSQIHLHLWPGLCPHRSSAAQISLFASLTWSMHSTSLQSLPSKCECFIFGTKEILNYVNLNFPIASTIKTKALLLKCFDQAIHKPETPFSHFNCKIYWNFYLSWC